MVSLEQGAPLFELRDLARRGTVQYRKLQARTARIDDPIAVAGGFAALVSAPLAPPAVMRIAGERLKASALQLPVTVDPGNLSRGEMRAFRRPDGQPVHGIYYAPRSAHFRGPRGAAPPALVFVHGGPTSMTDAGLKLRVQFYTSRGFAVFDVNYSGSTGYGRAYRERLDGQWGIADVEDCAAAARYLAKAGLADAGRIAISGGSAGGYTTLMALATTDAFAAGSSHYGVSDLALLFAAHAQVRVGLPAPPDGHHAQELEGNLRQALADQPDRRHRRAGDPVPGPRRQGGAARAIAPIVDKLRARGIDVAYHEFAGEAHGFRKAETIIAVLDAELAFLRRVLRLG